MSPLPALFLVLAMAIAPCAAAQPVALAIVTQDRVALRAAPRSAAPANALLWQGETVEVRGHRLDYLQVYDYKRERGGYVRASQVQRIFLTPEHAPELLAVLRLLRLVPGAEALGIGFAAAYIEAAPAEAFDSEVGVEALDALGSFAEQLAHRASGGGQNRAALSAHLDVAGRYGVRFTSTEGNGRVHLCYDGEAFRRVLAMRSSPEQRARAALALTRPECMPADLRPPERRRIDEWRAEVLDRVETAGLPAHLRNRILMRRAALWSSLAYQRARQGDPAEAAGERALSALAGIDKAELADDDAPRYNDAAMQVGASRWAAVSPNPAVAAERRLHIVTAAGEAGDTCVLLVHGKSDARRPLVKRCTYALVWSASATLNREGTALALSVQPTDTWRELWIFRKSSAGWTVRVLPPAAATPHLGYAEFAGWVPGGQRMLVTREARGDGKYKRSFEVLRLDTLATVGEAKEPGQLRAFQRWQDASWKSQTVSVR